MKRALAWLALGLVAIIPAVALAAEVATGEPDGRTLGLFGGGATIGAGLLYLGRVIAGLGVKLMKRLDADEAHRKAELEAWHLAKEHRDSERKAWDRATAHYEREEGALGEILRAVSPEYVPQGERLEVVERTLAALRDHLGIAEEVRESPSRPIHLRRRDT